MNPHAPSPLAELLADPGVEAQRKHAALLDFVQKQGQLPPGCEWIWRQGTAASSATEPGLLVPLLATLDTTSLSRLLTAFLASPPTAESLRSVCEGLVQVCETDRGRRFALAVFLDHRQLARPALLELLRSARPLRERMCEVYPPQSLGLPSLLRAVLNELPDDPAFESSVEVLLGMKSLLPDEAKRIAGWRNAREKLQELEQLQQQAPGWIAHVVRVPLNSHRARIARVGQELAEAASWGMPHELYPDDTDGTQRAALVVQVARRVIGAKPFPAEFPTCLATCIAGGDWSAGLRKWEAEERARAVAGRGRSAPRPKPSQATPPRVPTTAAPDPSAAATSPVPVVAPASSRTRKSSAGSLTTSATGASDARSLATSATAGSSLPSDILEPEDAFEGRAIRLKVAAVWLVPLVVAVIVGGVVASQFLGSRSTEVAQVDPVPSDSSASTGTVPPKISTPPKKEIPKPAPKPPVQVPPKPVKPEPEAVAVVTPVVPKPMPPEPVAEPVAVVPDKAPVTNGLVDASFTVGPEKQSIAYVPLPPYPEADTNSPEIRFDLPGELPVRGLKLHGFKEHKSRLSDSFFVLREDARQASKRVLEVLHACMAKDAPAYQLPLCTFEIRDQKVGVFRWHRQQTIGLVQPLEEAVRCCVLEVERGNGPEDSLLVSFLKPVVIEPAVEFDAQGLGLLPAAELRLVELSNPIALGPARLRISRDVAVKRDAFVFASHSLPRRIGASFDDMKLTLGFTSATLFAPLSPTKRDGDAMTVELKVAVRLLRADEMKARTELVTRISGHRAALRKPTGINSANDYLVRESKLKMTYKEPEADYRVRVVAAINQQLAALEASRDAIDAVPKSERAALLSSKPRLTGKFYRVVGGQSDGTDIVGGVVVDAFEIRDSKPPTKGMVASE